MAHGATMIEKHFTVSRDDGGVDSSFSLEPHEMKMLAEECKSAWQSLGEIKFGHSKSEEVSLSGRRSIYLCKDVKAGEELTIENMKIIRPNGGLAPKYFKTILGRKIKVDLKRGTPLSWDCF